MFRFSSIYIDLHGLFSHISAAKLKCIGLKLMWWLMGSEGKILGVPQGSIWAWWRPELLEGLPSELLGRIIFLGTYFLKDLACIVIPNDKNHGHCLFTPADYDAIIFKSVSKE